MSQASSKPAGTPRSYEHLVFPGWGISLLSVFGGMALSFALFGVFYPYWWFADQDIILVYQGLLLNDGLPQEYFDHTGYLYHLLLALWFSLLHATGLLPIHVLSELPPKTDVAAFDDAWQQVVVAGRFLSLLLAGGFMALFGLLVRRLVGDCRVAVLAAMALACSGAVIMHMRMMRTELLSGGLAVTALLVVLLAAQEKLAWRRLLWLALGGLCATLAVTTKVQAVLLVCAIPPIAMTFGRAGEASGQGTLRPVAIWGLVGVAVVAALPATRLVIEGTAAFPGPMQYFRLGPIPDGTYQAAIALWVVAGILLYGRIWRLPTMLTVGALAAVLLGVSLGMLSLLIRFHEQNLIATTHPIEHLFFFARWSSSALAQEPQILTGTLFETFAAGFGRALIAHDYEPIFLLQIFALVGAVIAWRRGDRLLPAQVAVLLGVVLVLDAAFTLRSIKVEYYIYTDPLLILAAALVAARFPAWQAWTWQRRTSIAALAFLILWGNHLPVRQFLFSTHDPKLSCEWQPILLERVGFFPFCEGPPQG